MYYIYCYVNKINQHKYVGQTNNLKRRNKEHKSCAFNEKASSYNDLIHQKIRQYGIDNFDIITLEIIYEDNIDLVNEREIYWIKEKNSFCKNGEGYNMSIGGGRRGYSSILSEQEIKDIKQDIKQGTPYYEIEKKYNISPSFISGINNGIYFQENNENYPLYKYYKKDEDYDELIDLLLNSYYTLAQIAKMLDMGYSTVKKINAGTLRKGLYPNHPIRKNVSTGNSYRANKIKELLKENKMNKKEIAKMMNVSDETVRRINIGETFFDSNLEYPLNNL